MYASSASARYAARNTSTAATPPTHAAISGAEDVVVPVGSSLRVGASSTLVIQTYRPVGVVRVFAPRLGPHAVIRYSFITPLDSTSSNPGVRPGSTSPG